MSFFVLCYDSFLYTVLPVFPNRLFQRSYLAKEYVPFLIRNRLNACYSLMIQNDLYNPFDQIQLGLALIAPTSDCVLHGIKVLLRMPALLYWSKNKTIRISFHERLRRGYFCGRRRAS